MISVDLIGGSRLLRGGLKLVLEERGTEIVREYASTEEVTPRDPGTPPIIYLLLHSPGRRQISQEIDNLRRADAHCRIAVMLSRLAADNLVEVFASGGDALVLEEISAQALHESLTLVALGEKVFPSQLAALLSNDRRAKADPPENPLTARQLEVVRRLALGQSNKVIANDLELAPATVKVHVKSLLKKLGLSNRTQAAIWAVNSGLADPSEVTGNVADDLQQEPLPEREAEAPLNHFKELASERRTARIQSSLAAPSSPAPRTSAVEGGMLLRRGLGERTPRTFTLHRSKSD